MSNPLARFNTLNNGGLGLPKGSVELKGHNPRWKRVFSDEAYLIFDSLRIEDLRLYHIGSTSIPQISAKPVIDILGSVESLKALDDKKDKLLELGYEYKGEYGIEGRRYCVLKNTDKSLSYAHIHFFEHSHLAIKKHLLFRDYLRLNSDSRKRYEDLKLDLISAQVGSEYTDKKAPLISQLLSEAENHLSKPRKVLAILGSAEGGSHTIKYLQEISTSYEQLEIIDLNHIQVSAYNYKHKYQEGDQYIQLIKKMIDSDLVLFASPVYWYAMTGSMKDFFDRFSDLLSGPYKELGEKLYGKKIELISTGYEEKMPVGFEVPFSCTAIYFGMDYMGARYKMMRGST